MNTLDDVRAFIAREAARLDPQSRYVTELIAIVERANSVHHLHKLLEAGCRGQHWAGEASFSHMTIEEKLRCNLITNETQLMRFGAPELEFLRQKVLPALRRPHRKPQILSLPCSHGEEAVSLASECSSAGLREFAVQGIDIQPECIAMAQSGRVPYPGLPHGVVCTVQPYLKRRLRYSVGNVFESALGGPYDLVVCRNFLGYFTHAFVREALVRLCAAMRPNESYLLVDDFILGKHPAAFDGLPLRRIDGVPAFVSFGVGAGVSP